jgi:hypothetical protein
VRWKEISAHSQKEKNMICNTHFSDASAADYSSTWNGALRVIAHRYQVKLDDMEWEETDTGRTLVWLDEASAKNDDGGKAVAEIIEEK